MAEVTFRNVSKRFPDGTLAVRDFNLDIADGEFVVLVGPSGCGKTTVLRSLAGIERVTSGEIRIGDRVVNELSPQKRDIAMVFQNYALYANMTVFENLAFALRNRGVAADEVSERVKRAARTLAITEFLDRKPAMLSGGQRQRVAIGRAIVRDPAAFLMDEPLSNLDAKLRGQMRAELTILHRELRATVLYVTHDQVEAMTMGDRVAVMWRGIIQQVAPPSELYDRPANLFVASFIGAPAMNFLHASLTDEGGRLTARAGALTLPLDDGWAAARPALRRHAGREVVLGVRPEHLDVKSQGSQSVRLDVIIDVVEALGYEKLVYFRAEAPRGHDAQGMLEGGKETAASGRIEFCARMGPDAPVREGPAQLFVDPGRLQVFDPETGAAIGADSQPGAASPRPIEPRSHEEREAGREGLL